VPTSNVSACELLRSPRIVLLPPQGYLEMLGLLAGATARAFGFRGLAGGNDGARRALPDDT
jgi:hypothetical protein